MVAVFNPVTVKYGVFGGMSVIGDSHVLVPLTLYCNVYDVMGVPPSDAGGVHVRDTRFNPDCAVKPVGASGTDHVDAVATALYGPVPIILVAAT